jgi:outer membrane immunogenic protein
MKPDLRNCFRLGLLASVAATALISRAAHAQPVPPVYMWTGFYVGANLGYYGTSFKSTDTDGEFGPTGTTHSLSSGGVLGGGQVGYNWEFNPIVLGVEGDIDGGSASSSGLGENEGGFHSGVSALGTLRGRVGYAFDPLPVMVYATGGLAFGDVTDKAFYAPVPAEDSANKSGWRVGWTAGGGAEYAFAPQWTVKAEVLYVDLGSTSAIDQEGCKFGFKSSAVVARGGVNFHF